MKKLIKLHTSPTAAGIKMLSDEDTGKLFRAIVEYFVTEELPEIKDERLYFLLLVLTAPSRMRKGYDDMTDDQKDISEEILFSLPDHDDHTGLPIKKENTAQRKPAGSDQTNAVAPALFTDDGDLSFEIFCDKTDASDIYDTFIKEDDDNKTDITQKTLSYQPVKKVEKSKSKVRVEEKESNKEKEERAKENQKEQRKLPSSPSLSVKRQQYETEISRKLKGGLKGISLSEREVLRLNELDHVTDIREITKEDLELLEKAEVLDLRVLVYSLKTYNAFMTDMLPDYTVTKKRLQAAADVFENAIENGLELQNLFKKASESSFLCGRKSFPGADFDWLMRIDRVEKVLSGFYDDYQ